MPNVDFDKIRQEYITTDISYRKLCEKYDVSNTTLYARAKKEKWVEKRKQFKSKTDAKVEDKASEARTLLYDLALAVARDLASIKDEHSLFELAVAQIKPRDITGAIKDLKTVLDVKSEADIEEQQARIANLRKQAEAAEHKDTDITVVFEGELDKYAE